MPHARRDPHGACRRNDPRPRVSLHEKHARGGVHELMPVVGMPVQPRPVGIAHGMSAHDHLPHRCRVFDVICLDGESLPRGERPTVPSWLTTSCTLLSTPMTLNVLGASMK